VSAAPNGSSSGTGAAAAPAAGSTLALYKSNTWTDLGLVLPIFLGYHLGVVLLKVRNAADPVTQRLTSLAENHIAMYWLLTLGIGGAMAAVMWLLGRREAFESKRFVLIAVESVLYALLMRLAAGYAVGSLPIASSGAAMGVGAAIVMSLGAGLYEEIAFRVGLFGLGALGIKLFFGGIFKWTFTAAWAVIAACVFAGWHYVGALGDPWNLRTFVFRAVCGLVLTAIYVFRGFAPAVWTHALYDVWALSLAG
jgi:hypothetical protein